ncbi:MAG: hypothetical protein H8E48_02975 [Chloroflexi bacterium]|nr:hypothetical protein [Chloroflexota bacterium]
MYRGKAILGFAGLVVTLGIALGLFTGFVWKPFANESEAITLASAGLGSQGFEVHGDWVVQVKETDGTVVSRREFKNALDPEARVKLMSLLTQSPKFWWGLWKVEFLDCCTISESAQDPSPLEVTTSGDGRVLLTGTVTAPSDTVLGHVKTSARTCDGSWPEYHNRGFCFDSFLFSETIMPESVSVVEGQEIEVTVIFSFS